MKTSEKSLPLLSEELTEEGWLKKNRFKERLHILTATASWLLFAYFWYLTLAYKFSGRRQFQELLALFIFALAVFITVVLWVHHNVRIWQQKGPRKQVPPVNITITKDKFNREVNIEAESFNADYIKILVNKKSKTYLLYKSSRIKELK
jgi:hypothetical protein